MKVNLIRYAIFLGPILTVIAQSTICNVQNLINGNKNLIDRPSSEPYLSGDTFRKYCDIVFDEEYKNFDPTKVNDGDIIFISQSGEPNPLAIFFTRYYSAIKARCIIVTHNGDHAITEHYRQYLDDDKIFLWFAQNIAFSHPKLIPIPIGLENAWWKRGYEKLIPTLQQQISETKQKKYLALLNFSINTKTAERLPIYNYFHDKAYCYCPGKKDLKAYLQDVANSKFVFSPQGNGFDCHRTWEALYLGAIPIVKTSTLDKLYEGLPVLIVNDWHEVTEELLEHQYQQMLSQTYTMQKLYIHYWLETFEAAKKDCKKSVEVIPCIDVVIPVCQKDLRTLDYAIDGIKKHGVGIRRVIVISDKRYTEKAEWFDEERYPFSKKDIEKKINELLPSGHSYNGKRNGWIYQQLLKLYAPFVIPEISENVLVLDSDTIFLKQISFFDQDGYALYNVGTENQKAYFEHAEKLITHKPIKKIFKEYSGICHHMLFQKKVLEDLFAEIRNTHNMEPWQAFLACINPDWLSYSCMSEYEIYFNFIFSRNYKVKIRKLTWDNCRFNQNQIKNMRKSYYHYISCHAFYG